MKLFLTSSGFSDSASAKSAIKKLDKSPKQCSVLMFSYTVNSHEEFYVQKSITELKNLGFIHITSVNMGQEVNIASLSIPDIIYMCGGNTHSILEKIRMNHLDKYIIDCVRIGTAYVGVSAGSIIAGPNIEIAGWGPEGDHNEVGLADLQGFGLVNTIIFPHANPSLKVEVEEFRRTTSYPVVELSDGQILYVEDGVQLLLT